MPIVVEPGGPGRIYSLNGVAGALNRGRSLEQKVTSVADSTVVQVLGPNPNRCWAIISNRNVNAVQVFLGNSNTAYATIGQYGTVQLDVNLSWSGEVLVYQTSGGALNIDTIEAFVTQ